MIKKISLRIFKIFNIIISLNLKFYYVFFKYLISPAFEHKIILNQIGSISTFVDVGANRGQFSLLANFFFPKSKILIFEPLLTEFNILSNIFKKNNNIKIFNFAVGNLIGQKYIYETKDKDSSSILKPTRLQLRYFPKTFIVNSYKVKMVRLKYFLKNLNKPIFLKIDVQGYELEVLKGASLSDIKYIYLEASYIQLYKKQPLIDDIIKYLLSKNFKLIKISNCFKDKKKIIQADLLFMNRIYDN
jgi:FkbM family methyltransferase